MSQLSFNDSSLKSLIFVECYLSRVTATIYVRIVRIPTEKKPRAIHCPLTGPVISKLRRISNIYIQKLMSPSEKFENVLFKTVTSVFINQQQQTIDAKFTTASDNDNRSSTVKRNTDCLTIMVNGTHVIKI